jgi:Heterokaryon incompatibility protein (HET)
MKLGHVTSTTRRFDQFNLVLERTFLLNCGLFCRKDESSLEKENVFGRAKCRPSRSPLYQPLQTATSIRLFTIKPGIPTELIDCELRVVEPREALPHEAISYIWGNSGNHCCILCNGKKFIGKANLFIALRNVRKSNVHRTVWIDAFVHKSKRP